MSFTVTAMQAEHVAEIARLEKECFSSPCSEAALAEELSNSDSHFLVAECDGIAGYIGVQEICGEAYITNIAVFGEYRKAGIGRALLKSACDGAKSRNCSFITLEVRESNYPAISLYESEGFKRVGVRKNFYSSPTENAVLFTKNFEV
jgi:ribosomal-protein-alanine N-acetyltransferase